MAVTQKDIALKVGTSQQAVASALSGRGSSRISEKMRSDILREAKRMGYRPNLAARALTKQRTFLVAVWTKNLSSPYYASILQHLEAELRASQYAMIVRVFPSQTAAPSQKNWEDPQWPVDGVLAIEMAQKAEQFRSSHPESPPIVCVGAYDASVPDLDYVWVDLYKGSRQAVEHLLERGCRRVAILVHEMAFGSGAPRYQAYNDAMSHAGLQPEYIVVPETTRLAARFALQNHVAQHGYPDGLFCHNDDLALGAYRFLCDEGKRVPDDVALVGCDGIEDTLYLEQPLSTIVAPVAEMCCAAWKMLQLRIENGKAQPCHEVLQAQLEVRASSQR